MVSTVVIGGFFGDEGKGKIISYLALHDKLLLEVGLVLMLDTLSKMVKKHTK